jgi:secreted trypsin-like serine protease
VGVAPLALRRRVRRTLLFAVFVLGALGVTAPSAPAATAPEPDLSASVVGGRPIAANDYRSLAAIMVTFRELEPRDRLLCTGTVITRRWILTAGHCAEAVLFGVPLIVQAGSPALGDPRAVTAHINRAVVHKSFWKRGTGFDVALFHTATNLDVPITRLAVAADLPLSAEGRKATIVGWGLTKRLGIEQFPDGNAHPPVRARAVEVPIVGDAACTEIYRDVRPRYFVAGSDMCAGAEGRNACYGDSGGPLYSRDGQGQLVEIGLTSRGAGCATKLFPGIFTDVRRVHGWIHRYTHNPCPNRVTLEEPGFPPPPGFELGPLYAC